MSSTSSLVDASPELMRAIHTYYMRRHSEAIQLLIPHALAGVAEAQLFLARSFLWGEENIRSNKRGTYWLQRAARGGNPEAQERLGGILRDGGKGMTKSLASARHWFQMAARNGYPKAIDQLAYLYFKGMGVTQNWKKSLELSRQSHELGSIYGTNFLGWFYERGIIVERDYARAREYYELAINRGSDVARFNLGTLYEYGRGVEADRDRARQLYELAARGKVGDATDALTRMKREDEGDKS